MRGADRFGVGDWLKSIGGVAVLRRGPPAVVEAVEFDGPASSATFNAFNYQLTGLVPYVIFVAIAILTIIIRTESLRLPPHPDRPAVDAAWPPRSPPCSSGIRFFMDGYDDAP